MARHHREGRRPWYRGPVATGMAGGAAVALLGALALTVIRLSDDWSNPTTPVFTTPPVSTGPAPETRRGESLVITPSQTPQSFPTSASVSTTDIGVPTTSGTDTTPTTPGTSTTPTTPGTPTTPTTTSKPTTESPTSSRKLTPPTTRKRPRLNETP